MKKIKTRKYKQGEWQSLTMGNIVDTFGEVIKQVWESLIKYHTLDIRWKYNKTGEYLPPFIYTIPTLIDKEWNDIAECDKKETISNYLLNEYSVRYKSFEYKEFKNVLYITNIEWCKED